MRSKWYRYVAVCSWLWACTANAPPEIRFKDSGQAIQELQQEYGFERVDYENWEPDDATDSSFTVCFINSRRLPVGNVDGQAAAFKKIAGTIRNVTIHPEQYGSYYIIFVTEQDSPTGKVRSHTAGMEVPVSGL